GVAINCGAAGFALDDPKQAETVLRQALAHPGPAVVECTVDANEPPLPGNITVEQAFHFAEALLRGDKHRGAIIKTVLKDRIRELV
ncbi:MAG TPA: pyruvate oxidase, partial [Terriglobales bacterium]